MSNAPLFSDRHAAGLKLAKAILAEIDQLNAAGISARPIVYALPRGGIPVAAPIAQTLNCPLTVVVAKKITRPNNPELAIGAVTADGQVVWSGFKPLQKITSLTHGEALQIAQEKAQAQLNQFSPVYPTVNPQDAIAILVDDGIATGMTMAAAAKALLAQKPKQIWLCAPVAPKELINWLQQWGDRTIILHTPVEFASVSRFYAEFPQVETETALEYLLQHKQRSFN